MGIIQEPCCCRCDELLGVGTDREIEVGDDVRIFTTAGGAGPVPFQGTLVAVENGTIVINDEIMNTDGNQSDAQFARFCCAHIAVIEKR